MAIDVIIIGAGASGLYLASHLKGLNVYLFEKNTRIGLKVLASGSGQCNITHDGYINGFFDKYGTKKKFVKAALSQHDNHAVMAYFKSHGLALHIREDGKVFPETFRSADVVAVLRSGCAHVSIQLDEAVAKCSFDDGMYTVSTEKGTYRSRQLVIATGGKSYPQLGATGDGYAFAYGFGHTIAPIKPGLTGVVSREKVLTALSGMSLDGCVITLIDGTNKSAKKFKDQKMLFTHFGLSGPLIINNSRHFDKGDILSINFLGKPREKLEAAFAELVRDSGNRPLAYYINALDLPTALKDILFPESVVDRQIKLSQVTKDLRRLLMNKLTEYELEIESLIGFNQAMVTVGGVSIEEVEPKTMASKLQEGLYLIGEVLDVDGDTGGYNLQWAFSSAYACAQRILGGKL